MKYSCFNSFFLVHSFVFFLSCSSDTANPNKPTPVGSRPVVPPQNGEVQIGNQIWMTKNLNVSRYRNGDPIPQVTDPTQWANLTTGAWCYYNSDPTNGTKYGRLYNWYAVTDPRGLAPAGWHVPSNEEWNTITIFLGDAFVAGGKLKSVDGWQLPNAEATNSTGFTALPGGIRNNLGVFTTVETKCYLWSSSNSNSSFAYGRYLTNDTGSLAFPYTFNKKYGFSVRCIKD